MFALNSSVDEYMNIFIFVRKINLFPPSSRSKPHED